MKTYTVNVNCGETTCATEPGKFCSHFGSKHFGTYPVCMLFNDTPLEDKDGWLQRCQQCLDAVK